MLFLLALASFACGRPEPAPTVAPEPPMVATPETTTDAIALLRDGDYLQAHQAVAETMTSAPSAALRCLRGLALLGRQQQDQARAAFDEVRAESPDDACAAVGLGHLAINDQDYASAEGLLAPTAEACAARAAQLSDHDAYVCEMAWLGQGWVASNHARFEQALGHYDRILAAHPDHRLARLGRGNALSGLGRLDEAGAQFEAVLVDHPDDPYARAELGLVLYNQGDDAGAQQAFEAALAQDPTRYTCPHEGLGLVWLRQGRTTDAKAAFERAIEINPDIEYKKYNGLARILIQEGRLDEARALLDKSIANYPYDPEAAQLLESLPE